MPFLLGWKKSNDTPFFLGDYFDTNFPLIPVEEILENSCRLERVYGRAVLVFEEDENTVPIKVNGADGPSWLHFIFTKEDLQNFDKNRQLILTEELRDTFYQNFQPNRRTTASLDAVRGEIAKVKRKKTIGIHVRRTTIHDTTDWGEPSIPIIARYATDVAVSKSCDCAVVVSTDMLATQSIKSSLASVGLTVVVPMEIHGLQDEGLRTVVDFLVLSEVDELFRRADSTFSALPQLLGELTATVYTGNSTGLGVSEPYVLSGAAL